ncbi:hypothetical protein KGF57_004305 [Candida theae]|uniref:WD repeat protein mio zinc-ribbon like domain-containing protein n=1 Tax=Candida theae TaxID=1198502 RepID=A0AAD5FX85_9ASCO|nr:uncharacterized protein KGF57_004305 [Candida theae]KAI5950490.1 hypothetical protein KGF57_004305 [Candida theae]
MASITRAANWDNVFEQQFIAIPPAADEVVLYQTSHEDSNIESNTIVPIKSMGGFDNIQCSSYLTTRPGMIGVGSINGNISIFDINTSSPPVLHLHPKQTRPCNTISFNNSNLIVAGFDKGRQDNSLQIWDIHDYSKTGGGAANEKTSHGSLSSYIPNEAVLSTVFFSETNVLCGSYKFLREVDTRADQPIYQIATKCTSGLMVDPFQPHLFQSYSEDGTLFIWDRRKLTSNNRKSKSSSNVLVENPILQFNKLLSGPSFRKNLRPCVRYSAVRKGEFSAIFNGDLIRRWHTGVVPPKKVIPSKSVESATLQSLVQQSSVLYKSNEESLFVSMVLDNKTDYEKVVSFDYSPDILSRTSTNFVCMRQSGSVFRMPVVESIEAFDFNPYNEFSIAGPEGTTTNFLTPEDAFLNIDNDDGGRRRTHHHSKLADLSIDENFRDDTSSITNEDASVEDQAMLSSEKRFSNDEPKSERDFDTYLDTNSINLNDICVVIRKRANMGYGVLPDTNIKILEALDPNDNQLALRHVWKWLSLAKKSLDKGTMISEGIDLGYQGVQGIWNGVDALNDQNRVISARDEITEAWFSQAVKSIISSKGKKFVGINIPEDSEKKVQRKLCLIVSGWYLTGSEFDEKLSQLVAMGMVSKAAGWAVFHGNVNKAIEILSNSKRERLRLMATAIAGYLAYKNTHTNSPWKDQCRKMASELDDPYLRAIFAFIADDDWWDVLDEHSLPLRERIGVAVRFLPDRDLTVYLNRIGDSVVQRGELEGLILTGITPRGIDLLQSFVDRTSDVQTAALLSAFACPRYFADVRVRHWIDCYRNLLNSWGMFNVRAKLDVSRTKLSKAFDGEKRIKASPKQVYLQCSRCNKNMSKAHYNANSQNLMKQFSKSGMKKNSLLNSCPHCGAPLPRCSICMLSLGTEAPSDNETLGSRNEEIDNKFRNWFSFCLSCNHCYHAHHAEEWFSTHGICPVPDCDCQCNSK